MVVGQSAHCKKGQKRELRLLKILNSNADLAVKICDGEYCFTSPKDKKNYKFDVTFIKQTQRVGHISIKDGKVKLEQTGSAYLKRLLYPENPFVAQNSEIETQTLKINDTHNDVTVNVAESPLSRLHFRKDRTGKSWLNNQEYLAGEKFRSDFERGGLQPKISANWEVGVSNSSKNNRSAELSDFAIDCRTRLEAAIDALGPELKGIVLDVCCYLKGLETVEKEKGWPPRSAKLLLKTGLSILVRHYGIGQNNIKPVQASWAGEGYKPTI